MAEGRRSSAQGCSQMGSRERCGVVSPPPRHLSQAAERQRDARRAGDPPAWARPCSGGRLGPFNSWWNRTMPPSINLPRDAPPAHRRAGCALCACVSTERLGELPAQAGSTCRARTAPRPGSWVPPGMRGRPAVLLGLAVTGPSAPPPARAREVGRGNFVPAAQQRQQGGEVLQRRLAGEVLLRRPARLGAGTPPSSSGWRCARSGRRWPHRASMPSR